jgi:hypothetical protein
MWFSQPSAGGISVCMSEGYWRRVTSKAWGDTLHDLSLDSPARVAARILVAIIGVGFIGYFFGAQDFQAKLLIGLFSAGAVCIAFALFFLLNLLFFTPAELNAEANEKISALQQQQSTKQERQAVADLADEIDWATQNLLNPTPHPLTRAKQEPAIEKWRAICEGWIAKVSAKLENKKYFTHHQKLHFDTLANVDQIISPHHGPKRFVHMYNIVSTKIQRLRDLIEQLSRV